MKKAAADTGRIARSAGTVSVAVMCSRVLGLVREQVFAVMFGAGFAYDAFVVAFRIPNLLRDLFGEGALSSAFVAVFSDYDANRGADATWKLANSVLAFFTVVLSLVTLAGMVLSGPLVQLMVDPEFIQVPGKVELTRQLTVIMFPFLVFISQAAVVMGILNTKGRFFVPAMASSYFNLGSIVGGLGLALLLPKFGYPAIIGMAFGTLIGGLLQLACQLPTLWKAGFALAPRLELADPGLRRIIRLMIPAVIGLSATQINVFINTRFASSCAEGSVSWLNYAFRLVQLPIGVFGVAISIAALPVISRYAAARDLGRMRETLTSAMTLAFCLTIPASFGLWLLSEPVIRVIFQYGAFTALDTARTAEALRFYAVGLFAYSAVKIMVPVFFALDDTRYPVIASFLAVAANYASVTAFIGVFQHRAIALSTSCAMIGNFFFLALVLYKKLGGYSLSYLVEGIIKILVASLAMSGWLWLLLYLGRNFFMGSVMIQLAAIVLAIFTAVMVYGGVLYLLKVKELSLIIDKVRERLGLRS